MRTSAATAAGGAVLCSAAGANCPRRLALLLMLLTTAATVCQQVIIFLILGYHCLNMKNFFGTHVMRVLPNNLQCSSWGKTKYKIQALLQ